MALVVAPSGPSIKPPISRLRASFYISFLFLSLLLHTAQRRLASLQPQQAGGTLTWLICRRSSDAAGKSGGECDAGGKSVTRGRCGWGLGALVVPYLLLGPWLQESGWLAGWRGQALALAGAHNQEVMGHPLFCSQRVYLVVNVNICWP